METITLHIGSVVVIDGREQDNLRPVKFKGEEVGSCEWFTDDRGTRGVTETLYKVETGQLVVHDEDWSRWQGEPTVRKLVAVQPVDLDVGGRYERLGRACGMARPLTLDEALSATEEG